MLRNRVPKKDGYNEIVSSDESVKMYSRAAPSRAAFNGLAAATALIGIVAVVGIIIASTGYYGYGPSPMFDNIKVSGTVNTTTLVSESIGFGSVDVQNLTTVNHTSITIDTGHLNANDVWVNSVNSTTVSATSVNSTAITAESVLVNMVQFTPLVVTTSGELSASHNTFHLNSATDAMNLTLPSDLTPLIGKRLKICSVDGKKHVLDASPNFVDAGNLWSKIRFQEGAACCIELDILTGSSVSIQSGIHSKCALLCEGYLCVDPSDPEGSNPLFGQWLQQTQRYETWNVLLAITLDGNALRVNRYSGSPFTQIREMALLETFFIAAPPSETASLTSETSFRITADVAIDNALYDKYDGYKLQTDTDVMTGTATSNNLFYVAPYVYSRVSKTDGIDIVKSNQNYAGDISVSGGEAGTYDVNSIRNQFSEMIGQIRTMNCPQMAVDLESSVYPGEQESRAQEDKHLDEGFGSFNSDIVDVWPSFQNCFAFCDSGFAYTTSIFTNNFSNVANFARVTISGFGTGTDSASPFAVLNGDHRVMRGGDKSLQAADPTSIYLPTHYDPATHRHMFNVDVDTQAIRVMGRTYHPDVDGVAVVTVTYFPIRENMAPADYFAAYGRWLNDNIYQVHTYAVAYAKADGTGYETFDELHADQQSFNFFSDYIDARYDDPVMNGGGRSTGGNSAVINDKYESPFNFDHTPEQNYLEEKYHIWYAVDPSTSSVPGKLSGTMTDRGFNANGSRFMFTYAPIGSTPVFPYPGAPQAASGTIWSRLAPVGDRTISFGLIQTNLTTSPTAYIFIPDEVQGPDEFQTNDFAPDGSQGYPDLKTTFRTASVHVYMYSVVFEKIMSYSPERIIIDTRSNNGGYPVQLQAVASFFGGDRHGIAGIIYTRDVGHGNTPARSLQDFVNSGLEFEPGFDVMQQILDSVYINVSKVEQEFGAGRVFSGTGKECIILTSVNSASAGDVLPWAFVGDDTGNFRDIGGNTTVKFVGNIDGRLAGGSAASPIFSTTSKDTKSLYFGFQNGYIHQYVEQYFTLSKIGYPSFVNQHPATAMDLLLSSYVGDTTWVDEGYITPHPDAPLAGWTAAGNVQEITIIGCLSGAGLNQSGYFLIDSTTTQYYVWYNLDAGGADPTVGGKTGIEVAALAADSADAIAIKTVNAMGPLGEWFLEFTSTNAFTARVKLAGSVAASSDVSSNNGIIQALASATGVVGEVLSSDKSTYRDRWLEKAITV